MNFTPLQQKIINGFKETQLVKKFYLTGGTLLAVKYLGHRHSLDLDFFCNSPFTLSDIEKQVMLLAKHAKVNIREFRRVADRFEWELGDDKEQTKVEFVFYNFKAVRIRRFWNGILTDTLEDIAANKVIALLERHEPKDIFDIYFILTKKKWRLGRILRLMKQKFGLPISQHTFFSEAEIALKRLDAIRGLLLTDFPEEQDKLIEIIHAYFDRKARQYLRDQFK